MWSVGVIDLGLDPEAVWDLTPRELSALADRRRKLNESRFTELDSLAARIEAMVWNANRQSDKSPFLKPFDLMVTRRARTALPAPVTPEERAANELAVINRLDAFAARMKKRQG